MLKEYKNAFNIFLNADKIINFILSKRRAEFNFNHSSFSIIFLTHSKVLLSNIKHKLQVNHSIKKICSAF